MTFDEVLEQVRELLAAKGRVTYRALKVRFDLTDEHLAACTEELIEAERVAVDEAGKVLVWVGDAPVQSSLPPPPDTSDPQLRTSNSKRPAAERRQLTVLFCDLVGSTALSAQLDPEDLRAVIQQYQQTCAAVIQRHEGYIAQYLGDGLLVYFGYPTAHEDDARRAVRTGLEIVEALKDQGTGDGEQGRHPSLQVRLGIHSGLVVIGDMGGSGRTEQLALGETPNIAARLQGLADPNTVLISAATQRLITDQFESQPFGSHLLKGIPTPIAVYHVQGERQSAAALAGRGTLTPLVGREQEVGLLLDRWEQAKEGRGHVVLLSGEPGIGKSRLAYTLREHVTAEGSLLFEARCSPYHQQSALYPLVEVMQRTLGFTRPESDRDKVEKLERTLALYNLQDQLPLFTALLSLPSPPQYPALTLTPQKQKERTLQAVVQMIVAQAGRQATVSVWEDVHWADPSSLEFLAVLIEQIPTTQLLLVLTFRPEFVPPWKPRSHLSQLVLNRLGKKHVEVMIERAAGGPLAPEVIEQIRVKTDGVPLFVEELTKSVVEARGQGTGDGEQGRKAVDILAIPATLQETLLARLDRLSSARPVAQLGATLGREFSHELIQAVAPVSEPDLHAALAKLVEAEILYQRGSGEQARYIFKHALIQDTAYHSLLKSTRQHYHQQIAQVLAEQFPDATATQPELLAHHYTKAGLIEQAIPYWQQAGQRASERSANVEAVSHLTKSLELLKTQPDTPARAQQELSLQMTLGPVFMATKGYAAPEVGVVYSRARELCQQVGELPRLFPILFGLWVFHTVRAEHRMACELAGQLLPLAQSVQDSALLLEAHHALGQTLFFLGELAPARAHVEQGIALYDPHQHHFLSFLYGAGDPGVFCRGFAAYALWLLGYPDQALERSHEALVLAQELSHPHSLASTLNHGAMLHHFRREVDTTQERVKEMMALAHEQGFPFWLAMGHLWQGWVLAEQGQGEEGITQMRQGMATLQATGARQLGSYSLTLLAKAYGQVGQTIEGLALLDQALYLVDKTGEHFWEAEMYRLKGELTLQKEARGWRLETGSSFPQAPSFKPLASLAVKQEAEGHLLKAIAVAQKQQAKSLELRAVVSLARLWQRQDKQAEARQMLAEIYGWFTEGFDTKDLQEARALLSELG